MQTLLWKVTHRREGLSGKRCQIQTRLASTKKRRGLSQTAAGPYHALPPPRINNGLMELQVSEGRLQLDDPAAALSDTTRGAPGCTAVQVVHSHCLNEPLSILWDLSLIPAINEEKRTCQQHAIAPEISIMFTNLILRSMFILHLVGHCLDL